MKRVLFIVACAFCAVAAVRAQQVFKRVQFPPGGTTAVLEGRTNSSSSVVYQLIARAGQHMTVHLTSPKKDVKCQIHPANAELLPGALDVTHWEGALPKDGEYDILVFIERGSDTYALKVTIAPGASDQGEKPVERPSDLAPAVRAQRASIEFSPGSSPATLKGYVNPLSSAEYKLTVSANQRVAVHLTSTSRKKLVRFKIQRDRFTGKPLSGADYVTDWEGVFKEGGDYWISVFAHPDAGEENFTLVISTPPNTQDEHSRTEALRRGN